jgi:hypothetical protein
MGCRAEHRQHSRIGRIGRIGPFIRGVPTWPMVRPFSLTINGGRHHELLESFRAKYPYRHTLPSTPASHTAIMATFARSIGHDTPSTIPIKLSLPAPLRSDLGMSTGVHGSIVGRACTLAIDWVGRTPIGVIDTTPKPILPIRRQVPLTKVDDHHVHVTSDTV